MTYAIRKLVRRDVPAIAETFASWNKNREQYERYLDENLRGERITLVAVVGERLVGYVNVLWESDYEPFRRGGIPEINDLNVINDHQGQGIGTALIHAAESIIAEAGVTLLGSVLAKRQITLQLSVFILD